MDSIKRKGLILILLITCCLGLKGQVVMNSGGNYNYQSDTTSIYSGKNVWNLSRIVNMIKWIEGNRRGRTDSVYMSKMNAICGELKFLRDSHVNYAVLDKQINLLNNKQENAWKEYYKRTSPYGIIRNEILSKKPDETDLLVLDGIKFLEEDEPVKAYQNFKNAIEKDSTRLNNYYFVIMVEMEINGDTVKALESINNVIKKSHGLAISHFNPFLLRAWIYGTRKQYIAAFQDLNQVLNKDPYNLDALLNRGNVKTELKDFAGSVSDYQQVLKCFQFKPFRVNMDSAMIFNGIGWNYYLSKDYKLCLEYAGKSLSLRPDDPYTLDTRGSGYYGLGEYEKCIDEMTKAIGIDPDLENSWYLRGMSNLKLNRKNKASADLSKAAGLGNVEAADAIKENCLLPSGTDVENQKQFSNKKIQDSRNRLRIDWYGIYYRL